jgi:hypothetical protein
MKLTSILELEPGIKEKKKKEMFNNSPKPK